MHEADVPSLPHDARAVDLALPPPPQVTQPFIVALVTFFGSLALKTVAAYIKTGVRNGLK